jgi:CoA:oxalate CoA-transferase
MCCNSLAGVHVLECSHYIAGPRCGQILADHGADVIKLEPPHGDPSRAAQPRHQGISLYFASHNRKKRSVSADLKQATGRSVLERLIGWADVIVTNYSPRATTNLGLDFAAASRINPRIVVLQISAFGVDGPERDRGAFDGTLQAESGLADMTGPEDGPPIVSPVPVLDHLSAVEGAFGVMAGLRRRDETGEGQAVEVAMMDVAMSVLGWAYGDVLARGTRPHRHGSRAPYAFTTAYAAADGYVFVALMGDQTWSRLFSIIGRSEWFEDGSPYRDSDNRLRDRDLIEAAIEAWTRRHSRDEIEATLRAAGIPCSPINALDEAIRAPRVTNRGLVQWVRAGAAGDVVVPVPGVEVTLGERREQPESIVPDLGEDTETVLAELGFEPEVAHLLRAEVEAVRTSSG